MSEITSDELKHLCDATIELCKIRAQGVPHLCVENLAPEILGKLLGKLAMHKNGLIQMEVDLYNAKKNN